MFKASVYNTRGVVRVKIAAIMAGGMDGEVESGRIGETVATRGGTLQWFYRRLGDGVPASTNGFDALIVFGGEQSVHDPELKPYFDGLGTCIRRFHQQGKPVLGSCLGCQAIAYAFGAEVKPQGFLEYGFTRLSLSAAARTDLLLQGLDEQPLLFEMHSDTFDLPDGAVALMSGDQVPNQAFRMGTTTWAFQCHFEVTPHIVDIWNRRELIGNPEKNQDDVNRMIQQTQQDFEQYQQAQTLFARTLMNRWLDQVEAG
tara:strand:- start:6103 stop:6873 length:771 start_codon:yes stop_codon:yes gene_type:complete